MRGRLLVLCLGLSFGVAACSDDSNEEHGECRHSERERDARAADVRASDRDAALDAADANADVEPDALAQCCPISPEPSCCMQYGGSRLLGAFCDFSCDGMPLPSPLWSLQHDEYGCPYWVEPPRSADCCGCIRPDAGD